MSTTVEHLNPDSPEDVAQDLLLAAFSAIGAIQSQGWTETSFLAKAQNSVNDAYVTLSEIRASRRGQIARHYPEAGN